MKLSKMIFALFIVSALSLQACVSTGGRSKDPEQAANIYADLGLQYMQQGNLELALIKLENSLDIDKNHKAGNHYIAELYKQMGNAEMAGQYYKKAVKLDPNNPNILNNYGAFLCGQGHFEKSESYILRAVKSPRYRTPELAYENLALCALATKNIEKAEAYFRQSLAINPSLPNPLYQMALIQFDKKDYLRARAFIERLHSVGYTRPSLQLAIKVEQIQGDNEAVSRYINLLKEKYPEAELE